MQRAQSQNVANIVAIRGDAPEGETEFQAVDGGFRYGNELTQFIHDEFPDLGIAVGGYPEKHPEARNIYHDVDNLRVKVDAGADIVITQLFYNNESYFSFLDTCAASGIEVPIVPGLLPITNYNQVKRITSMCGAKMPIKLANALEHCQDDVDEQLKVGIDHAGAASGGIDGARRARNPFLCIEQMQGDVRNPGSIEFSRRLNSPQHALQTGLQFPPFGLFK